MLDLLQDFMYKLFKSDVHPFSLANGVLPLNLSFGPLLKAPSSRSFDTETRCPFILMGAFPLFYNLSPSNLLYSSIHLIN